jgi:hypothetical protein
MRERYAAWPLSAKIMLWLFVLIVLIPVIAFFLQRAIGVEAEEAVLLLVS